MSEISDDIYQNGSFKDNNSCVIKKICLKGKDAAVFIQNMKISKDVKLTKAVKKRIRESFAMIQSIA